MQDLQFDSSDHGSNLHACVYYSLPSEQASDPFQVDLVQ